MKRLLLIPMLFLSLTGWSQDINGIWKGKLVMASGGCFPVYNIEFQLQAAGTRIIGTAYHFSDSMNYLKKSFEGVIKKDSNIILIRETSVLTSKISQGCVNCMKNYVLSYHKGGGNVVTEEQLRGEWRTPTGKAADDSTVCDPGTIVLVRFDRSTFKPDYKLPPSLVNRKAELVREIKVDTGTIKIDFYDNGQIDGDTVSVYVNNMPQVSNRRLSAKPISIDVKIDLKRTEQEVIMVGENLGSIPPNTALMIINAGDKRYQLYLTSDEQKNAMVRFVYEKPLKKINSH